MKEGFYKSTTPNYIFDLEVIEYDGIYEIKYGDVKSKDGPCVELIYDTRIIDTILKLDSISYYKRCAKNKNLERGDGTREMLKSILKICIDKFPKIKKIYFHDVSAIPYGTRHVSLSYYSLLQYNMTWYQRHFQAKPKNKIDRQHLDKFCELLTQKPKVGIFTFYKTPTNHQTWNEYFISKKNDFKFFINIKNEIRYILQMDLNYSEWYIRAKDVANYDVNYDVKRKKSENKFVQSGGSCRYLQLFTMEDV
jgi:hypothetical protein